MSDNDLTDYDDQELIGELLDIEYYIEKLCSEWDQWDFTEDIPF
jgi:hypothetical protein